jgi:hypothetical protein
MDQRLTVPNARTPVTPTGDSGGHALLLPVTGSTLLLDPKALKRLDDTRAPGPRKPYEALFELDD